MEQLIIEGNSLYELDEECLRRKEAGLCCSGTSKTTEKTMGLSKQSNGNKSESCLIVGICLAAYYKKHNHGIKKV